MSNRAIGFAGGLMSGIEFGRRYKDQTALAAWRKARAAKTTEAPTTMASSEPSMLDQGAAAVKDFFTPQAGGVMDRLTAGNIDQPGSEAHQRWGAERDGQAALETPEGQAAVQQLDADSMAAAQANLNETQSEIVTPKEWSDLETAGHSSDHQEYNSADYNGH